MGKRRSGIGAYKRAIQIRWRQFLRRFEQERKRRANEGKENAMKIIEAAGLLILEAVFAG